MIAKEGSDQSIQPPDHRLSAGAQEESCCRLRAACCAASLALMSKCPFQALVGKLGAGSAPSSSASSSARPVEDTAAAPAVGVCPLGFGSNKAAASADGKCPLGFGSSSSASAGAAGGAAALPAPTATMTLAELQAEGPTKGLVSVKGVIFNVSARREEMAPLLGHDCSRFFALGGGGGGGGGPAPASSTAALGDDTDSMLDQGLDGLTYKQVVRLERVLEAFVQTFAPPVALLGDVDRQVLLGGTASMAGGPQEGGKWLEGEDGGLELHALVEEGANVVAIEALLAGLDGAAAAAVVNCPCPRTGLAPLHKVLVEGMAVEVVQLLVAKGADLQAKADLYDGDTPLLLARRFRRGTEVEALLVQRS